MHATTERKLAPGSLCIIASALRFLYKVTLKRPWVDAAIPLPKVWGEAADGLPQAPAASLGSSLREKRVANQNLRGICVLMPQHPDQRHARAGGNQSGGS